MIDVVGVRSGTRPWVLVGERLRDHRRCGGNSAPRCIKSPNHQPTNASGVWVNSANSDIIFLSKGAPRDQGFADERDGHETRGRPPLRLRFRVRRDQVDAPALEWTDVDADVEGVMPEFVREDDAAQGFHRRAREIGAQPDLAAPVVGAAVHAEPGQARPIADVRPQIQGDLIGVPWGES